MPLQRPAPVPITEPEPVHQRIAWWIENAFTRIAKRVFNAVKDSLQDLIAFAFREFMDDIETGLIGDMSPLLDEIQGYTDLPSWIRQTIANARTGEHAAGIILLAPLVLALTQVLQSGIQQAISPIVAHRLNAIFRAQLGDSYSSISLYVRGIISKDDLLQLTRANGWPDWQTDQYIQLAQRLTSEDMLLVGYWRGLVSDTKVTDQLTKAGYKSEDIELWKQLSERIPSPGDLISIAVREGFDDSVARQFGYDEAFPSDAADAAEKGGMPKEWFARMWRAHWRLPSVTQGFDMFHRGIMSRSELDLLLRASDIPSFWREKLVQLSYSVITRVDVRRMYALGVYTEEDVYSSYLDVGYSPKDARDLTEWTVAEYAETERELTKTEILSMYRDSVLNEGETEAYLTALGYNPPTIGLLLAREDLAKEAAYEKQVVANVKSAFMAGIYDETDVRAELGKLDPPAGYVDDTLELWRLEKTRRLVRPTVTQLRDMWLTEVITDNELRRELEGRGYSDTYIRWYQALWTSEE
jgi:hypothetical protein